MRKSVYEYTSATTATRCGVNGIYSTHMSGFERLMSNVDVVGPCEQCVTHVSQSHETHNLYAFSSIEREARQKKPSEVRVGSSFRQRVESHHHRQRLCGQITV